MFGFIKEKLQKIYSSITTNLLTIFLQKKISAESLAEIERILKEYTQNSQNALAMVNAAGKVNNGLTSKK